MPDADVSGEIPVAQQFSWWDQHAGKVLAGVALALILGAGGWLVQMDRNTVRTNFLLDQIASDIGELRTGLKAVDGLENRVRDNEHDIEDLQKKVADIEAQLKSLEKTRRR